MSSARERNEVPSIGSATSDFIMATSCQPVCTHISMVNPTLSLPYSSPPLTTRAMSLHTAPQPGTGVGSSDKADPNPPKLPPHWNFGGEEGHTYFCWWPFFHCLHHLLCVIGFGHASLVDLWKVTHPKCSSEVWEHGRDLLRERMEHINLVVRLRQS